MSEALSYTYFTNNTFKKLEKQLLKLLGDDWKKPVEEKTKVKEVPPVPEKEPKGGG
ncbi:MAG: hypothetical protein ACJAVK_001691 [Akkermansiaceae bacterium]